MTQTLLIVHVISIFYDFVVFYEFNKQLLDEGKQK